MKVCFVKHPGCDRSYLFRCDDVYNYIRKDSKVIVSTMRGSKNAIVVSDVIEIDGDIESMISATGAYLPLRQVICTVSDLALTDKEKELIAREWLTKKLGVSELPF